jgi:Tfp pilus assembly protein PilN
VSQVNLLPPEILELQVWQRRKVAVVVIGAVVAALLIGYWLFLGTQLSSVESEIEDQNRTNESVRTSIAQKQKFADLQTEAQQKEGLVAAAYQGEVSFSALLMDFSRVIPADAFVDSLTLQVNDPTTGAAAAGEAEGTVGLVGSISGGGQAVSVDSIATFLTRLESVKGWVNPFISTVDRVQEVNGFAYSLSVDLTDEVVTERGKEASGAAG